MYEALIDEGEYARLVGVPLSTARKQRYRGDAPPHVTVGRSIRFRRSDVQAWIAEKMKRSTGVPS